MSFFALPVEPVYQDDPSVETDEALDIKRQELLQTIEVFKKRGWKHVEERLQKHIDASTNLILSGGATTMDEIVKHRERIAAFRLLLDMPASARQEVDLITSQLTE